MGVVASAALIAGNQDGRLMIFFQSCIQQSSVFKNNKNLILNMFSIPFERINEQSDCCFMKSFYCLLAALFMFTMATSQYVALYAITPNNIADSNREKEIMIKGSARVNMVSIPAYQYFRVKNDSVKRPCIIICPGGGYSHLAVSHEGVDVARFLNSIGVNALLLKYRMPNSMNQSNKSIAPLQDAQQAIHLARLHADEWGIISDKTGVMGFSAGGHVAASLANHYMDSKIVQPENISLRPDFQVLIYPVISFRDFGHAGSRKNLIGPDFSAEQIQYFSNEEQVNAQSPPAFIVHAKDDLVVPVKNSEIYHEALQKNKVPTYLYLFDNGGHGFGMANAQSQEQWPVLLEKWLKEGHYISK
jgi:acetyl esterase/lipase